MISRPFQLLQRGKAWKAHVERILASATSELSHLKQAFEAIRESEHDRRNRVSELRATIEELSAKLDRLSFRQDLLAGQDGLAFQAAVAGPFLERIDAIAALGNDYQVLLARRSGTLLALFLAQNDPLIDSLGGLDPVLAIKSALDGSIREAIVLVPDGGGQTIPHRCAEFLAAIVRTPSGALAWAEARKPPGNRVEPDTDYFAKLDDILSDLDRLDFHALGSFTTGKKTVVTNTPFDEPALLPDFIPAQPKRRSVIFTHHSYYNFYYLSKSLRSRGWDAISLSVEHPENPNRRFYHGEDITIFDSDPTVHKRMIQSFLKENADRFGIIHSYGVGILSLFSENHASPSHTTGYPWDVLEAKRRGVLIGYTHSGCLDGVSQSSFRAWSPSTCANCPWENEPTVCSDTRNLEWGRKATSIVDLFCTETDPPLDYKSSEKTFRAPLTFAIDPDFWPEDLQIPSEYDRKRVEDEVVVYHAMGNYKLRSREGRNVKGTGAVVGAVQRLQSEGIKIRLDFVENMPTRDNRYVQAQADIIVDQLNYGRYGALAREGMMLGKPVVGRVNKMDGDSLPATRCILDTPIVNADETTIIDVLRDLALDPAKRDSIGRASREHAIQWWSGDRLAERFERVYDHLREHGRPPSEDEVP